MQKNYVFFLFVNSRCVFFPFFSPRRDPSSLLRERGPRKTTRRTKISRNRMEIHGFRWSFVWSQHTKKKRKKNSLSLFSFPRVEVLREFRCFANWFSGLFYFFFALLSSKKRLRTLSLLSLSLSLSRLFSKKKKKNDEQRRRRRPRRRR